MSTIIARAPRFNPRNLNKREFLTPFDELFNSMMDNMFPGFNREFGQDFFLQGAYPKCNVVNFDDRIEIEAAIPGLAKDDVSVEVVQDVLTIKGNSKQRKEIKDTQYVKREVKRSAFSRSFHLHENLDEAGITASHKDGILTLAIPKIQPSFVEPIVHKVQIK
jgi:HSP20 family protein